MSQKPRFRIYDDPKGAYSGTGLVLRNVDSGFFVTVPADQVYMLADALVDYIEQRDQQQAA